jgi:glutathione S-transferase
LHGTRGLAGNFKKIILNRMENGTDTATPGPTSTMSAGEETPNTYKIIYFNVRARAEIARLMFAYMNIQYDDIRLTEAEWAEKKSDTVFGQLPVLDVNGEMLAQSAAINRFLAKQFGLSGSTPLESARIDMFCCWVEDFVRAVRPWIMNASRCSADAPAQLVDLKPKVVAPFVTKLMSFLEKSGNQFLMGPKPTLADFVLYHVLETFVMIDDSKTFMTNHPELAEGFMKRFSDLPGIKEWIVRRPKTRV